MGITPAIWDQMRTPKAGSGGELAENTQFYVDFFIALDCLHIPYSEYIARVPQIEREANQLYLALKGLKEAYAIEQAQAKAEAERMMARNPVNGYRA